MSKTHLIELKNISYGYSSDTSPVLQNLNFIVGEERVGLVGPNGCGKTTLFHIIVGLLQPSSGQILFKGKVIESQEGFKALRKDVGFLFQSSDDQLFSPTVLEDVAFGPLNLGFSADESRDIALSTLDRLGLKGFENRITHKLSGGEKKLVALATILSMEPELLLLDEPTNNLDSATRNRLQEILNGLQLPYIIISHDWDFLAETTSSLYTFDHGHLHLCEKNHIHEHRHIHAYGDHPHQHND
jgi:cobalt/nickel transport system ATP-binding protein